MQNRCVPMIHVPDVRAAIDWYQGIGFHVVETFDNGSSGLSFAILSFGSTQVMFNAGGRAASQERRDVDLYLYCADVDGIHARLKERVDVIEGPHDTFYAMREILVRDLNGFWITFGEERSAEALLAEARGDRAPHELSPEALDAYVGLYTEAGGNRVRVVRKDDHLVAFPDESGAVMLLPISGTEFKPVGLHDASLAFQLVSGRAEVLNFTQGAIRLSFTRTNDEPAS